MNIREIDSCLQISTPAKINLFLEISRRRDDGFHELETIMTKLSVFDHMEFIPTGDTRLELEVSTSARIDASLVPSDETNLILKSMRLVQVLAGKAVGATVRLFKNIPIQAGLGGASGNAAGAIVAANRIWQLNWPLSRLQEVAGQIGSDVAFFLSNGLARCTGCGEKVENLHFPLRLNVVVAKPSAGSSTPDIYSRCVVPQQPINTEAIVSGLQSGRVSLIGRSLFNRLQPFAADGNDEITRMRYEFGRTPCTGHQLTGSGSCYFGIYPNRRSMLAAAWILANRLPDMHVFTGHTLSSRNYCLRT